MTGLRWPGLPDDPAYPVASVQMRRMPGVLSFDLGDADRVARFLDAARLVAAATSFGGLHTTADRRAQWGDDTAPGFVRLSCGVEDTADLVADIAAALDASGGLVGSGLGAPGEPGRVSSAIVTGSHGPRGPRPEEVRPIHQHRTGAPSASASPGK